MLESSIEGKFNLSPDDTETSDVPMQELILHFREQHIQQPKRNTKEAGQALHRALEIMFYKKSRQYLFWKINQIAIALKY